MRMEGYDRQGRLTKRFEVVSAAEKDRRPLVFETDAD